MRGPGALLLRGLRGKSLVWYWGLQNDLLRYPHLAAAPMVLNYLDSWPPEGYVESVVDAEYRIL